MINSAEFSNTAFFVVSANIPGISVAPTQSNFRNRKGFVPGETIEYEQLSVRMAIDENMEAYKEIFDWIVAQSNVVGGVVHDLSLVVLSSHSNPNKRFAFKNAFPISLGAIEFSTQESDVEYSYVDVSFQYDSFEIKSV